MSRKWNIPLTYSPKIQPVIDGTCRQTIRTGRKFSVGDLIRFYTWAGRPYHSKRTTITEYVEIKEVFAIDINFRGIMTYNYEGFPAKFFKWDELDWLALKDGIVPATGWSLGAVLKDKNTIGTIGIDAQIVRW
jgi:hypothetical protein